METAEFGRTATRLPVPELDRGPSGHSVNAFAAIRYRFLAGLAG